MSRPLVIGGKLLKIGGKRMVFPEAVSASSSFTYSPLYPAEGETVDFTFTGTATSWSWRKDGVEFSTAENPTGIDLGSADTYTIELIVDGGADTSSQDITVFPVGAVDSDAAAFATRHGSLTDAQFALVNSFVTRGKSAGWYSKMLAASPLIGGTAATHAHNLISSSYPLTFGAGTTHSSNGFVPGANTVATSGIVPSALMDFNDFAMGGYVRTATTTGTIFIGAQSDGPVNLNFNNEDFIGPSLQYGSGSTVSVGSDIGNQTGMTAVSRTAANDTRISQRGSIVLTDTTSRTVTGLPTVAIGFGGRNTESFGQNDNPNTNCFFFVSTGLTSAELLDLDDATEELQTGLGRSYLTNNADEQNFIDGIDDLLDGTDDVAVYSGAGVRNTGCWYPDATWVPYGGNNGVPITPRHMLFVGHYLPANGSTITFYAADNTPVTRTVSTSTQVADMAGLGGVYVVKLSADLPGTITIPKLAPANLDALCRASVLPAVSVHRGTQAYVGMCQWVNSTKTQMALVASSDADRAAVFAQATGGVSGSWAGLRAADTGEPVTLYVTENGSSTSSIMSTGEFVGAYLTQITAAVNATGNEGHSISVWS